MSKAMNPATESILSNYFNKVGSSNPIMLCDKNGAILPGLMSMFSVGDIVTIKNVTFTVAYVNEGFVGFEKTSCIIDVKEKE